MAVDDLDPRHLRSALEFAVAMASEGQKLKRPIPFPSGLRKYLKLSRLSTSSLPAVRRIVEGDDLFRTRLAAGAVPELVDPIGKLWLERPDGWEAEIRRLAAAADAEEEAADHERLLKRSEKRREAAEQAAARARVEVVRVAEDLAESEAVVAGLRSKVAEMSAALAAARDDLVGARNDARHARDREAAALGRAEAAERALAQERSERGQAEEVRDGALADRAAAAAERSELARLASVAAQLAGELYVVAAPFGVDGVDARRTPLALPGGVLGDSETASTFLLRSGASVLVDGYNVAKLGWPRLSLAEQRAVLLDAVENLAKRFGSDITVVFDGADVVGAAADARRVVRVVYSADGAIADDLIRDEVRRLPARRQVVVVTNDREIVADVRAMGANTMSSDQLLALAR